MSAKPWAMASSMSWTLTSSQAQTIDLSITDRRPPSRLARGDRFAPSHPAGHEEPRHRGPAVLVGLHDEAVRRADPPRVRAGRGREIVKRRGRQRDRDGVAPGALAVRGVER